MDATGRIRIVVDDEVEFLMSEEQMRYLESTKDESFYSCKTSYADRTLEDFDSALSVPEDEGRAPQYDDVTPVIFDEDVTPTSIPSSDNTSVYPSPKTLGAIAKIAAQFNLIQGTGSSEPKDAFSEAGYGGQIPTAGNEKASATVSRLTNASPMLEPSVDLPQSADSDLLAKVAPIPRENRTSSNSRSTSPPVDEGGLSSTTVKCSPSHEGKCLHPIPTIKLKRPSAGGTDDKYSGNLVSSTESHGIKFKQVSHSEYLNKPTKEEMENKENNIKARRKTDHLKAPSIIPPLGGKAVRPPLESHWKRTTPAKMRPVVDGIDVQDVADRLSKANLAQKTKNLREQSFKGSGIHLSRLAAPNIKKSSKVAEYIKGNQSSQEANGTPKVEIMRTPPATSRIPLKMVHQSSRLFGRPLASTSQLKSPAPLITIHKHPKVNESPLRINESVYETFEAKASSSIASKLKTRK